MLQFINFQDLFSLLLLAWRPPTFQKNFFQDYILVFKKLFLEEGSQNKNLSLFYSVGMEPKPMDWGPPF